MENSRELPKYECHKVVWALKIKTIQFIPRDTSQDIDGLSPGESGRTAILTPEDSHYAPFTVGEEYIAKHSPKEGGYYVQYKDGYKSFSPADAFESGYKLIK